VRPLRVVAGLMLGCAGAGCAGRTTSRVEPAPTAAALPRLVSTDELARWQQQGPVRIVDVRADLFTYLKDHLPAAVYLNIETLRASAGGIPAQLLSPRAYAELFGRLGLRLDQPVDLVLAGHTHGGQVVNRNGARVCAPRSLLLPTRDLRARRGSARRSGVNPLEALRAD